MARRARHRVDVCVDRRGSRVDSSVPTPPVSVPPPPRSMAEKRTLVRVDAGQVGGSVVSVEVGLVFVAVQAVLLMRQVKRSLGETQNDRMYLKTGLQVFT